MSFFTVNVYEVAGVRFEIAIGDVVPEALPEPGIYDTAYWKFPVIVTGCINIRLIDVAEGVAIRFWTGPTGTK